VRTQYGPFVLDKLEAGAMVEVSPWKVARFMDELETKGALSPAPTIRKS
jgi:16S rRNA U516 pseudouridylate synthase RsuA-like enzyme